MNTRVASNVWTKLFITTLGFALLAVSARLYIPLEPVPITFQPLAVMVLGLCFPKWPARSAGAFYVLMGFAGVPYLFTAAVGWATAGYLVGFVFAIWAMTALRDLLDERSFKSLLLLNCVGVLCIYVPGVLWLSSGLGLKSAIQLGVLPFILPGLFKSLILAGIVRFLRAGRPVAR
ncbi:MAG: biotin transporter BioY [Deltaproteobacteria bacterium]|nr:biotin transporter BioY [Deltaproteobacteria bacterium]